MNSKVANDVRDFTSRHYKEILKAAKKDYKFVMYGSGLPDFWHVIMRHDVDVSIYNALKMAQIERSLGVRSTYFVRLHSPFYNLLEKGPSEIAEKIRQMGHEIGLHFEAEYYGKMSKAQLARRLAQEKKIIDDYFGIKVKSFSFHNPSHYKMMRFDDDKMAGMINAYGKKIMNNYKYCSDSSGYWRHERIIDVVRCKKYSRINILTHPVWWNARSGSPKERVRLAIEQMGRHAMGSYVDELHSAGRRDVG